MNRDMTTTDGLDDRDREISLEVAYRMQAEWTGQDMLRATNTAAMLARIETERAVLAEVEQHFAGNDAVTEAVLLRRLTGQWPDV